MASASRGSSRGVERAASGAGVEAEETEGVGSAVSAGAAGCSTPAAIVQSVVAALREMTGGPLDAS